MTAGSKLTIPVALLPTLSAVLQNTSANNFEGRKDGGLPTPIKQMLDVGFSLTPQLGKRARIHVEANFKMLTIQMRKEELRLVWN